MADPATKPEPFAVRTKSGPPAATELGERLVSCCAKPMLAMLNRQSPIRLLFAVRRI
jgi:hypothetical protein